MRDLNRKNSEERKQTVSVNSQNLRKCELKIYLLTEVLYELVKMFFARIQLTGGPDKHSMSQSERIYRFDSRPDRKPVFSLFLIRYLVSLHDLLKPGKPIEHEWKSPENCPNSVCFHK